MGRAKSPPRACAQAPHLSRKRPGSFVAARPGRGGPSGLTSRAGAPDTRARCPPDRVRLARLAAHPRPLSRLSPVALESWGAREDLGAERGGGKGLAGRRSDIWSFGRTGGIGHRRRTRGEAKHQPGPRSPRPQLPGAPVFPASGFPSWGSLGPSPVHTRSPSAGGSRALLPGALGGWERRGFVCEWIKPSVTMRYWGAGGGEAARLNGGPVRRYPAVCTASRSAFALISAGLDARTHAGPVRFPLTRSAPPPLYLFSNAVVC